MYLPIGKENSLRSKCDSYGQWNRQPVKITNEQKGSFFICGCSEDAEGRLFVMGYLANGAEEKGVIYRVMKG